MNYVSADLKMIFKCNSCDYEDIVANFLSVSLINDGEELYETDLDTDVQGVFGGRKCPKCGALYTNLYVLFNSKEV